MDKESYRLHALSLAWDTNKNRYNIEEKPTPEEIIEAAKKYCDFIFA